MSDYMDKYHRDLEESKEEKKGECPDQKEWDNKNFNPKAFEEMDKKYEEEEKLLSKLRFKTEEDKYVFNALPLLPTQKLEIVYQLIVENNDCIEVDEDLRNNILKIIRGSEGFQDSVETPQ